MDDSTSLYAKDTTLLLIEQLEASMGDIWKSYYQAVPTTPPTSADYPVCVVQKISGKAIVGPTQSDEVHETFQLTFVLNMADDIGSSNIKTTTMRHLELLIEGQDPDTLEYRSDSVLGVLRTYLTLGKWIINSNVDIKYDVVPKNSKDEPTLCVAHVEMTLWRRVIVNRQMSVPATT